MDDTTTMLATQDPATVLPIEGDSPLDTLRQQAEIHRAHQEMTAYFATQAQREEAVYAADDHIVHTLPTTLGPVLTDDHWTGYPALRENGLAPSAAAHLGHGTWVHHVQHHANGQVRDELTLIAPCPCGRGYRQALPLTEDLLLEAVTDFDSGPQPVFGDQECPHSCGSVRPSDQPF
ncbi:hypothetical protein ABZ769_35440 [Streptomyces olivoreticuli]